MRPLPQNYSQGLGPGMAQVRSRSRSCLHHLQGIMVFIIFRASWQNIILIHANFDRGLLNFIPFRSEHHLQAFQVMIYFKLYSFDSFYFCLRLKYLIICNNLFFKMLYQNNYFMTNKFKHLFLII